MWKVFRAIRNFFRAIDDFLTMCADYIDLRVRTGKAKGDIEIATEQIKEDTHEKVASTSKRVYNSTSFQQFLYITNKRWDRLMQITLFENIASLIINTIVLVKRFYGEIFLTFSLTFPTFLILLNLFENNPTIFFISFFPIVIYNSICLSTLYYRINKYEKGEKLFLWAEFKEALQRFSTVISTVFMHIFVILQSLILISIFALFLSYFFDLIKLNWTNSFIYWFLLISLIFFMIIFIFVFDIVANQAFYFALLQKKHPLQAFKSAWSLVEKHAFVFFFLYVLVYSIYFCFIYWATFTFFHTGFIISIFLFNSGIIFFSFVIRRKFLNKNYPIDSPTKHPSILSVIIIFGFFAYVLVAAFTLKEYPNIINLIEQSQADLSITKQLTKTYEDEKYGYSINYPTTWDLYGRTNNSITIYSNYTGTVSGGIWLNITVYPFTRDTFEKLFKSRSGLVSYDTKTTHSTIKISNIKIDGYPAVNFLTTKADIPYSQYKTHYLIHKGDRLYDIVFMTMSKDVEQRNAEVFRKIIGSFQFVK